jgi:hypothetical protein
MHDSDTYLYILDEGAIRELRKVIVQLGQKRLGPPAESVTATLAGITDLERLERIAEHLRDVQNWQQLLAVP